MCWEIIARANLGEFGTFNATHCATLRLRTPNPMSKRAADAPVLSEPSFKAKCPP